MANIAIIMEVLLLPAFNFLYYISAMSIVVVMPPQYQRHGLLEQDEHRATKMIRDWSISHLRKG